MFVVIFFIYIDLEENAKKVKKEREKKKAIESVEECGSSSINRIDSALDDPLKEESKENTENVVVDAIENESTEKNIVEEKEKTSDENFDSEGNATESVQSNERTETSELDESSADNTNSTDSDSNDKKSNKSDTGSKVFNETNNVDDNLIEIEDPDDYLMYLEAILFRCHARFYSYYDDTKQVKPFFSKLKNNLSKLEFLLIFTFLDTGFKNFTSKNT